MLNVLCENFCQDYIEDFIGFIIFMINFALCLICFCLSCWSEYPGPNYFGPDHSNKSTGRVSIRRKFQYKNNVVKKN